ncbi:MAG: (d)CMP kinase [Gemmatimonadetes bacterium]|nr:(d)CMP kinase [Gemmatimonadota bacterium]
MIVTIDGPAGSGKSSTAREVARRLGFRHLDSGAFYRALTYAALAAGIPPERWPELSAADLDAFQVHATLAERGYRLLVGDTDVSDRIRSPEVNANVSRIARIPAVRGWLLERLRDAARGTDLVADGRDLGTVVFPDADLKIFLVADPTERARRRLAEQGVTTPSAGELAAEVERLTLRDRIDSEREIAPLTKPADAVVLDTTTLDFDEQVERVVALVRARQRGARD